ncbi:hypothetical protein [Bradyrhizobium sp. USDA 4486]
MLFHRDTLPFDFLDVKSETPEHIEAIPLADFGVVVMGHRGRVEYATAHSKVNEGKQA